MRVLMVLALKDLRLLSRDRMGAFLAFGWPLLLAVFFGALGPIGTRGSAAPLEVGVVDQDASTASRAYVERLRAGGGVELVAAEHGQARRAVAEGERAAYLVIERGFGEALDRGRPGAARLVLGVDPRQRAVGGLLEGRLLERARTEPAPISIEIEEVGAAEVGLPPTPFAVTFTQAILWAVIACAASFGIGLVNERQQGTLLRLCVAPFSRAWVLGGKATACLMAILAMTALLLAVAVLGFDVRPLSWGLLLLAIGGVAVAFVGIMMVLAVIGRTAQSAAGLSWAILMSLALLGGGMLPLFMMPPWLQDAAKLSPVSWGLLAMEGAIWRGWTPEQVLVPTAGLVALGVLCFFGGVRAFRWQ